MKEYHQFFLGLPDTYSEHVQYVSPLYPAQEHNHPNDAEGIEGQLLSEQTHADLEWGFWRLQMKGNDIPVKCVKFWHNTECCYSSSNLMRPDRSGHIRWVVSHQRLI